MKLNSEIELDMQSVSQWAEAESDQYIVALLQSETNILELVSGLLTTLKSTINIL